MKTAPELNPGVSRRGFLRRALGIAGTLAVVPAKALVPVAAKSSPLALKIASLATKAAPVEGGFMVPLEFHAAIMKAARSKGVLSGTSRIFPSSFAVATPSEAPFADLPIAAIPSRLADAVSRCHPSFEDALREAWSRSA